MQALIVLAAAAFLAAAAPAVAQAPTPGELSPSNQDADMRPTTQSMQTVGDHTDRPGVDVHRPERASAAKAPKPAGKSTPQTSDPESREIDGVPPVSATQGASPHRL